MTARSGAGGGDRRRLEPGPEPRGSAGQGVPGERGQGSGETPPAHARPHGPSARFSLTARAWCQVAQKFTGGIGNKLCGKDREALVARGGREGDEGRCPGNEVVCPCRCQALLYGDAEKPVETGARAAAPGVAEPRPTCTCDKKPCGCQKADVNYAFLHSTGNGAPGARCFSKTNKKKTALRSGNCLRSRCEEAGGEGERGKGVRRYLVVRGGALRPQPWPPPGENSLKQQKIPKRKSKAVKSRVLEPAAFSF